MAIVRKLLLILVLLALLLFGAVFAVNNPDPIPVDIGLIRFESVSMPLAFASTFAAGWLFGVACAAIALLRLKAERRRLRRQLASAQAAKRNPGSLRARDAH